MEATPIVELIGEGAANFNAIGIGGVLGALCMLWIVFQIYALGKEAEK